MKQKMKWFIKSWLILFALHTQAHQDPTALLIERKKSYSFTYSLKSSDKISVENQFGDIRIVFWEKPQVAVSIQISASSASDVLAQRFLAQTTVSATKQEGGAYFKTILKKSSIPVHSYQNKGESNKVRIDYVVQMPKNNELNIVNSFGDIHLPDYPTKLSLQHSYGNLYTNRLKNTENHVQLSFGKAVIEALEGGQFKASYSSVWLDEARNLSLQNSFGDLHIKLAENIKGNISYSTGLIEKIKEAAHLQLSYSHKFGIGEIDRNTKEIDIQSSFSEIELPKTQEKGAYEFFIQGKHARFKYEGSQPIIFQKNTEKEPNTTPSSSFRMYRGKIGNVHAPETRIIIQSNYGNIRIR